MPGQADGVGVSGPTGRSLLVVTHVDFWRGGIGSRTRVAGLLAALRARGLRVHLVYAHHLPTSVRRALVARGFSSAAGVGGGLRRVRRWLRDRMPKRLLRGIRAALGMWRGLLGRPLRQGEPQTLTDFRDPRLLRAVSLAWRDIRPDIVLVEYLTFAFVLEAVGSGTVTVIDTIDVTHLRRKAFEERGLSHWLDLTREEERRELGGFDIVMAIQDSDAKAFRELLPGKTVVTCLPSFAIAEQSRVESESQRPAGAVLYVGNLVPVNWLGLEGFLEHSWPLVLEAHPAARLVVHGTVCDRFKGRSCRGVEFRGFVRDLDKAYAAADVVVSPVEFGGGIKIKCAEAMAHGKACVVSRHSAVGMEDAEGSALLVADDWEKFARHTIRLLADRGERERLARGALRYASRHFSPAASVAPLLEAISCHLQEEARGCGGSGP